jgi:DNA invertase Pin-like site-specific DNA recombinase
MNVWGYVRVSSDRQVEEGVSLEEQQRQLDGRALERGWQFARVFVEEGVSGGIPLGDRPQGRLLLAALKPGDIVLATKLDRMFRSAHDALNVISELQRRQVSLWLLDLGGDVSGNGIAKLMLTVLSAVAEFERDRIGERIRDAKRHQRQARRYLGGAAPYGWRRGEDGALVEDPDAQARLQMMQRMRAAGATLAAIGRAVGLHKGSVQRILNRETTS